MESCSPSSRKTYLLSLGILTGGITAAAGGITAAVLFGLLGALLFKSRPKS